MANLNEVDTNLRRLPTDMDNMPYSEIYDILYSIPASIIPIRPFSLLGALRLSEFLLDKHPRLDKQEIKILHDRISTLLAGSLLT